MSSAGAGAEAPPSAEVVRAATLRLMSDLKSLASECPPGVSASPVSDADLFSWVASIVGPDESPFEGGIYQLRITFPDQYPSKPPRVRFISEMFHPNIFADGSLCLDILQDKWKPVYTVGSILTSIQSLLTDPNNASPANPEAAALLAKNAKEYKRRVRKLAEKSTV